MDVQENIVNKVAQSGLVTLDLATLYPEGERVVYDIKQNLFQGLVLREKDFRAFVKDFDWSIYKDKIVAVYCSTDAIIPNWAFMILATKLHSYAKEVFFGSIEQLETALLQKSIDQLDLTEYNNQRVVVKGCGDIHVPVGAYVAISQRLSPVVKSLMYGEPCSTVPIFKKSE